MPASSRDWRLPLLIFALSRLWTFCFVYLGHALHPYLQPVPGGYAGLHNWWLNPWTTYDSWIFLHLARSGYDAAITGTYPLYSLLLKPLAPHLIAMGWWGFAISNIAFAASLIQMRRLTRLDYDDRVAVVAVLLLAFFPTTAYFSAVYSESLFLMCLLSCFLAVRQGRSGAAGWWGLLAGLTRNSGPLITLALVLEWRARRPLRSKAQLVAACMPLLGFLLVQGYFVHTFGHWMAGFSGHHHFHRSPSWPWQPLWSDLRDIAGGRGSDLTTVLNVAATIAAFALLALDWRRQPRSYAVLLGGIMLMHLGLGRTTAPRTNGSLRFLSTTFPMVQLMALHARQWADGPGPRRRLLLILLAASYLIAGAALSCLFGQKSFGG